MMNIFNTITDNLFWSLLYSCQLFFALRYGYGIIDGPRFFVIIAIFCLYMIIKEKRGMSLFDSSFFFLFCIYFLIGIYQHIFLDGQADTYNTLPYAWTCPTVYLLGKLVVGNNKTQLSNNASRTLFIVAIGMYIQGLLNYYAYFLYCDIPHDSPQAIWRTFWSDATDGTRNNWNNGFLMIISALFYAFMVRREKKKLFVGVIFASVLAVGINLYFAGRTLPAMLVLVFGIMTILYLIANHNRITVRAKAIIFSIIGIILLAVYYIHQLFLQNKYGLADLYNNSFLSRNGGIINNVRLRMWRLGLERAFLVEKGGWDLSDINSLPTTHNTWIEFARYYDIVIFLLVVAFLLITICGGIKVIFMYGNRYTVVYFAVAAQLSMIIYGMYEPIYIQNQDLLLFFLFVCGVISGIADVAKSGDYQLMGCASQPNRKRYLFMGLGLLSMALLASSYMDWWNDRLVLIPAVIIPTVAYIFGGSLRRQRYQLLVLLLSGISCLAFAIQMYKLSAKSEFFKFDLYTEPITGNTVGKDVYVALWIIPVAVIVGLLLYLVKLNKVIALVLCTAVTGIVCLPQIQDGRLVFIKEALRLQLGMKSGLQWIASKDNYLNIRTSHSMWLDFARDYGMVVFSLLLVFELWSIYCFIRMIMNQKKRASDYILMVAFILFNYQFMFETSAITSKYLFALGLLIYGMITASVGYNDVFDNKMDSSALRARFAGIKNALSDIRRPSASLIKNKSFAVTVIVILIVVLFYGATPKLQSAGSESNRLKQSKIIMGNVSLEEYLNKIAQMDCTAIFAVKDIGAPYVDEGALNAFSALGFTDMSFATLKEYHAFIGVYSAGEVLYQQIGGDELITYEGNVDGHNVFVQSGTYPSGNKADITIDGKQYAVDMRGYNIVIIDNQTDEFIDSIAYDVWNESVPIYRRVYGDLIYLTRTRN